jgi:hypothetical protein
MSAVVNNEAGRKAQAERQRKEDDGDEFHLVVCFGYRTKDALKNRRLDTGLWKKLT